MRGTSSAAATARSAESSSAQAVAGFCSFTAEDHRRLRAAMTGAGLEEVRFRFDFEGTKVVFA